MTVEELIAELEKFDPKLMVVRAGYEGGIEEVDLASPTKIALDVNNEWYYGPHETVCEYGFQDLSSYTQVDAVYIS